MSRIAKIIEKANKLIIALGWGFPGGASDKQPSASEEVGMIPWRRTWQPTPVFLPGEPHGQRNLAGYGPCGHKESDMTEHACTQTIYVK